MEGVNKMDPLTFIVGFFIGIIIGSLASELKCTKGNSAPERLGKSLKEIESGLKQGESFHITLMVDKSCCDNDDGKDDDQPISPRSPSEAWRNN